MTCRICLEDTGVLISPCACRGSSAYVHSDCLEKWTHIDGDIRTKCEICKNEYHYEESWSFQPDRYCTKCFQCSVKKPKHYKTLCNVLGCTIIIMAWTSYEYYIVVSAISTMVLSNFLLLHTWLGHESLHDCSNVVISMKCTFSLGFFICILAKYFMVQTSCESDCLLIGKVCDVKCSIYNKMTGVVESLDYVCMFELINLLILIVIRACFLCCIYMRKATYQNLMEDQLRLLTSELDATENSS